MSDQIPFLIDGRPPGTPVGRARRRPLVAAAAGVLTLGGGAVAFAASQDSTTQTSTAGTAAYGYGGARTGSPGAGAPGDRVHQPHLAGTVKSVSAGKILITDRDGFTRTIKLSSKTSYADGLTASPAAGTAIHAEGTVDADGVSLDATSVGKAPVGGPDGPGGHGMRRGGPGGPNGAPPSGTAAPKPSTSPS